MVLITFNQISKKDVGLAGGKGASLGEMTRAGIPVPPGFVLTAEAFDRFLAETDLTQEVENSLNRINYEDINSVDKASLIIRDLIKKARMPADIKRMVIDAFKKLKCQFVAVRSSATAEDSSVASWAGELETYLNTTEKTLLGNVKLCWSSLFTARSIFYRKEKNLHDTHVSVAVVIQAMIESEISGITFTVHPVTEDRNQMIIEAGWGLGEAIVSGAITPDSYVVDKRDFSLIDINISKQEREIKRGANGGVKWLKVPTDRGGRQILEGEKIIELAKLCKRVEDHYGLPQDIEWAYVRGRFYILQSRPITTL